MSEPIRITDLAVPVLSEIQRSIVGIDVSVELTEDAVLAAAVENTGLDDFGPDDFRARLRSWLAEIDADEGLLPATRMSHFNTCVRYMTARLRVLDLLRRHPEIHEIEIEAPLIVVGLPRSGTTHLLNLISSDTRWRSLPLWECYEPVPVPGEQPDGRFARCDAQWQASRTVLPLMAAMHPMEPGHIHEEIDLQGLNCAGYTIEWMARMPRWRDDYLAHDQTEHYEFLKTCLKVLQWQRGPDRWVLKSPQHLEQLGPLLSVFPDATIALTLRDPVSVVQSAATMLCYGARIQRRDIDPAFYLEHWTDRIERLLRASVRDLRRIPDGQRIDVPFHEFMAGDVAMVERIYKVAGMPMTREARAQIDAHMATHQRDRYGRVAYDLRADFGADPADVRKHFDFYFDAFDVPIEVK